MRLPEACHQANIAGLEKGLKPVAQAKRHVCDNRPSDDEIIARLRKCAPEHQTMLFETLTDHMAIEDRLRIMYSV